MLCLGLLASGCSRPDAGWVWMDVRSTLGATEKVWGNCRAATLRRDDDGREE